MKKVRLDLEALRVESFSTAADDAAKRGTVHGQQQTVPLCTRERTCHSACSWTDGFGACLTAGPCCTVDVTC